MTSSKPRLPTGAKLSDQPCVVRSKLPAYVEPNIALSVIAEGYTLFTYWGTCIDVFPLFRNTDHAPDLRGLGVVQPYPAESEHPVNLVAFFGCEIIEFLRHGFGVALNEAFTSCWAASIIHRLALRRSTSSRALLSSALKESIFSS
jgi:hypothetical protein